MKVFFQRILLTFTAIIIASFILELGLRIILPQKTVAIEKQDSFRCYRDSEVLPYEFIPNCAGTVPGTPPVRVRINSIGLRNHEIENSNKRRLLLVGDSFIFGAGVEEDARIGDVIEKNSQMEVISAGFFRSGPDTYYTYLRYWGLLLKPDIVAVAIFPQNDLEDLASTVWSVDEVGLNSVSWKGRKSAYDGYLTDGGWMNKSPFTLLDNSHLRIAIEDGYNGALIARHKIENRLRPIFGYQPKPVRYELLKTCLFDFQCTGEWKIAENKFRRTVQMTKHLAEKNDIRLVYLIISSSDQLIGHTPEISIMRRILEEENANHLDFYSLFQNSVATRDDLYNPDAHWSELGNELAAKETIKWLYRY